MAKRLKTIKAGRLCYSAVYTAMLPGDTPGVRAEKRKMSTAYRQKMNLTKAWQKLELLIAANFGRHDYHIVLTYDDEHLPSDKTAARNCIRKFIAMLRAGRRAGGRALYYVYNTEGLHGDGRIHHHLLVNGTPGMEEDIKSLWAYGLPLIKPIDEYQYEALAKYLTKEARELGRPEPGARSWVPSKNLKKPDAPPAEWVGDNVTVDAPPGAIILSSDSCRNEYGSFAFVKYLLADPPEGQQNRKYQKNE